MATISKITAVSTDGSGFAGDAVTNTIPVQVQSGSETFTPLMSDVQADDFATSSAANAAATQTLVAATGGLLPLVLADPTVSGPSAVVYPPQATPDGWPRRKP